MGVFALLFLSGTCPYSAGESHHQNEALAVRQWITQSGDFTKPSSSTSTNMAQTRGPALKPRVATLAQRPQIPKDAESREFTLIVPDGQNPLLYSAILTNSGLATATFTMSINGALFRSSEEVCATIIALPPEYPDEPEYRKAWRFVRDHRYHYTPLTGLRWQHSPALFMNSIGFGYCDDSASLLYHLWRRLGYEARVWSLWGHVISEVMVDGRWEMYDAGIPGVSDAYYDNYQGLQQCVYYYTREGLVAGVEDLVADGSLITAPYNPINPVLETSSGYYCYSSNIAQLYTTATNNLVSSFYPVDEIEYYLQFQIPPGGLLVMPGYYTNYLRVMYGDPAPPVFSTARLVIPPGFVGTLDNRLVIHSIHGNTQDVVRIDGQDFNVGSATLQNFIDRRVNDQGTHFSALTFTQVTEQVEVKLLLNPALVGMGPTNLLQLSGNSLTGLNASLQGVSTSLGFEYAGDTGNADVSWESSARFDYTLQTHTDLLSSDWQDVPGYIAIQGTGSRMFTNMPPREAPAGFMRIKSVAR